MVAILAILAVFGSIVAIAFLGEAADDALDEVTEGIDVDGDGEPDGLGVFGGECTEFVLAYQTLFTMGMFTAGAGEAQQEELDAQLGDLRGLVPSEIEDDFAVVEDAFQEAMSVGFAGALGGGEPSPDAEAEATAALESPEVVEAQANIDAWVAENCS